MLGDFRRLVDEALSRGHPVTAIARNAARLPPDKNLTVSNADANEPDDLASALKGHDVVISATPFRQVKPDSLINAVRRSGVKRYLVVGGAGSIAQRVAEDLGAAVRLQTPVRAIAQRDDHVLVESGALTVSARHAVVAVPPALALEIAFDPVLPEDRLTLYRHSTAGPETKTLLVYAEPFWRAPPAAAFSCS
jgi:putative NADH-flavin reductase